MENCFFTQYVERASYVPSIFLDPLFWQALGRVEGWDESYFHSEARDPYYSLGYDPAADAWKMNMHRMVDFLADGKTIEQFLETL